jgi:hypothetical protein
MSLQSPSFNKTKKKKAMVVVAVAFFVATKKKATVAILIPFFIATKPKTKGLKGRNLPSSSHSGLSVLALASSALSWVPFQARCLGSHFKRSRTLTIEFLGLASSAFEL